MSLTMPDEAKETREMKLTPPRGLDRSIARACRGIAAAQPAEERSPIASWLAENGDFLLDSYDALKREAARSPKLPAIDGETRVLRAARRLIAEHDGDVPKEEIAALLRAQRKFSPF